MSERITSDQEAAIVAHWRERAKGFDLKPGTKRYADAQMHFVSGACAALHATDPMVTGSALLSKRVPTHWIMAGMAGRDPFDP